MHVCLCVCVCSWKPLGNPASPSQSFSLLSHHAGAQGSGPTNNAAGPKRPTKTILLGSLQRGQNVNITIAGWKMTAEQV